MPFLQPSDVGDDGGDRLVVQSRDRRHGAEGERTYQTRCQSCHGPHGVGTTQGPPLVHRYYVPSHHADEAFRRAIRSGVVPHHWHFGPMPPVAGLDDQAVSGVIAYIRWLQQRQGID